MRQRLGQGDLILAGLREVRPDLGDRRVIVEPALIDEPGDDQRGDRLAGGEDRRQRVLAPGAGLLAVGVAAAQIDQHVAVADQGEGRADLAALGEIGVEGVRDRFETGRDEAETGRMGAHGGGIRPRAGRFKRAHRCRMR